MNLAILMTTLLFGNTTINIEERIEHHSVNKLESKDHTWQNNAEERMFQEEWQIYKNMYKKYYPNDIEEYQRKKIFIDNAKLIEKHNRLYFAGASSYGLGHNEFSDLTHEEFLERFITITQSASNDEENIYSTVRYKPDEETFVNEPTLRPQTNHRYTPTLRYDKFLGNDEAVSQETTLRSTPTLRYEDFLKVFGQETTLRNIPTLRYDKFLGNDEAVSQETTLRSTPTLRYEDVFKVFGQETTLRNIPTLRYDKFLGNDEAVSQETTLRSTPTLRYEDFFKVFGQETTLRNIPTLRYDKFLGNDEAVSQETTLRSTPTLRYEDFFKVFGQETTLRNIPTLRYKNYFSNKQSIDQEKTLRSKKLFRYDPTIGQETTVRYDVTTLLTEPTPTVRDEITTLLTEPTLRSNPKRFISYESNVYKLISPGGENDRQSSNMVYFDYVPPANIKLPLSVDWRTAGAVTPVKHQKKCKASWLFSATGALEGQAFRKNGHLTVLSEQNLLDCSDKYGNDGCNYGTIENAYKYISENGGLDTNVTYPWYGRKSWWCFRPKYPSNPTVRGVVKIQTGKERDLEAAVATVGPIAITVDARNRHFQFYKQGIYDDVTCKEPSSNHHMLVVGYGRKYWIVKNSFGKNWGLNGYIYMGKRGNNQCGITTNALYPLL